jgi:hypothetical protein
VRGEGGGMYSPGMVRREAKTEPPPKAGTSEVLARCVAPAGASPVPVGAGAPGSRPPPEVERPEGEARCRKPNAAKAVDGEQVRGPQQPVKPAASTEKQSGSRAAHVTAKAMSPAHESGWAGGPSGVRGAARGHGEARNTRGPSAPREGRSQRSPYKPEAKSVAAQRESEGVVVPMMAATNNDAGGKDPCFSHVWRVGKCEGMTAESGSNHPEGPSTFVQFKAREPQRPRLREGAKPLAQALRGGLSASRVREIRKHGLNGGPAPYQLKSTQ